MRNCEYAFYILQMLYFMLGIIALILTSNSFDEIIYNSLFKSIGYQVIESLSTILTCYYVVDRLLLIEKNRTIALIILLAIHTVLLFINIVFDQLYLMKLLFDSILHFLCLDMLHDMMVKNLIIL